jgi:hypothetical protein
MPNDEGTGTQMNQLEQLKIQLTAKVEFHKMAETNSRIYKMKNTGYHRAKSEAFQQALAMLEEVKG